MWTSSGARRSSSTGSRCAGSPLRSRTATSPFVTDEALGSDREPYWPETDAVAPDADAVLLFTSGTTARPKAVRVTHGNIQANTESILTFLELRTDDRALVILPFYYCYGASLLHTHLRCGARVVLCNSFAFPETALDLLEREECTVLAGVPSSFQLLLRASTFARAGTAVAPAHPAGRRKAAAGARRGAAWRPARRERCSSCTARRRPPRVFRTSRRTSSRRSPDPSARASPASS